MHIPKNPGEQTKVDWAVNPAYIIDPDAGEITSALIFVGVLTYSQYAFMEAFMNERTDNSYCGGKNYDKSKHNLQTA